MSNQNPFIPIETIENESQMFENILLPEIFRRLRVSMQGEITAVNSKKGTVNIKIGAKQLTSQNEYVDYPLLTNVPVFVLSGGSAVVNVPIKIGDKCLVIFTDRELGNYFETGNPVEPKGRMHNLTDCICLAGFGNSFNTEKVSLGYGGSEVSINESGKVVVGTQSNNVLQILQGLLKLLSTSTTPIPPSNLPAVVLQPKDIATLKQAISQLGELL